MSLGEKMDAEVKDEIERWPGLMKKVGVGSDFVVTHQPDIT